MAKSDNLFMVLALLRSRGQLTASEIAEELQVDVRTVYRYIDTLCMSGAPIASEAGPSGGYQLLSSAYDPPVFFDEVERRALIYATKAAEASSYPNSDALTRAIGKIRSRITDDQNRRLDRDASAVDAVRGETSAYSNLPDVERAVFECRSIKMSYRSTRRGEPVTNRLVDPWGLVFWHNNWYMLAWCHLREDERIFRVDRIAAVSITNCEFDRPEKGRVGERFMEAMVPQDLYDNPVVVELTGREGTVASLCRNWLISRWLTDRQPERLRFHVTWSGGIDYLSDYLLEYGSSLTVVEPDELRMHIREKALRIAEHHAKIPE